MHNTLFRNRPAGGGTRLFQPHCQRRRVMVHLFQWKFNDIANEVRDRAWGPRGFGGVQITPPAEHKQGSQVWWTVYQPVSFKNFNSFGGSEAELRSMIARCNAAGVKVYARRRLQPAGIGFRAPPPAAAATTRGNTSIPSSATTTSTTAATSPTTATATTSGTAPSTACRTSIPAHPTSRIRSPPL